MSVENVTVIWERQPSDGPMPTRLTLTIDGHRATYIEWHTAAKLFYGASTSQRGGRQ